MTFDPALADQALAANAPGLPGTPAPTFDPALADRVLAEDLRARLAGAAMDAHGVNPDQAARVNRLARAQGAPRSVVAADLPEFEMKEIANRFWSAPAATKAFLSDPANAAVAHDDVEHLSRIEQAWGAIKGVGRYLASVPDGTNNSLLGDVAAGVYGANRGAAGMFQAGLEPLAAAADPILGRKANPLSQMSGYFARLGAQANHNAQWMSPPQQGDLASGVSSGVQSLTQNLLTLPLAMLPGGQGAALGMMAGTQGGQSYQDAREAGIAPQMALPYATSQALVEYATEKLPLHRLIGDIKAGTPFFKTLARQIGAEMPGEQAATVLQDLNEWAVLHPDKPFSDYLAERPSAAAQTLVATVIGVGGSTALMHGGTKLSEIAADHARAARADRAASALHQTIDAAAQSKLAARDPDTFADLVRQIAGDGRLHMPATALDGLMQDGLLSADQVAALGVDDQLAPALAAGGDVLIDADKYISLARTLDQSAVSYIIDHTRPAPADWTPAEARLWRDDGAAREKSLSDMIDELAVAYDGARPGQVVEDQVARDLVATGQYTEDQARIYGELTRERMIVRAADRNMDPDQLWLEERPGIVGPAPDIAPDDIDIVLARLRSGRSVETPARPVQDILRQLGGVAPGSPLAEGLKGLGVTARTAPGLFRAGGLTDAGRVMVGDHPVLADNAVAGDANGHATHDGLMAALGREIAGDPLLPHDQRAQAARLDQPVAELRRMVTAAGLDPATVSRDDVRTLMQRKAASDKALGQPVNVGVDPNRMVQVVDLDPMLGAKRTPSDLAAKLRGIVNQPLKTADADRIAQVLPENVKHITYSSATPSPQDTPVHNKSVFNLPRLLEQAVLIESGPNTKTDKKPDVIDYHRFYVPVIDRGRIKVVRIVAHRTHDGIKIDPDAFDVYDVILENKKGGPQTSGSPYGSPSSAFLGGHPSSITIRQMLSGVKDMGGKAYFQPDGAGTPRGRFDPVANDITLFRAADLSTFAHESGHAWLFQMVHDLEDARLTETARNRIIADLRIVMDWLKVDVDIDAAIASNHPTDILDHVPVEAHEQWARGVEAWLMEGRAPSLALARVFATIAAWMTRIYRKVARLDVKLSPDIRAVMDRLVAAQDAIAAARAASPHDKVASVLRPLLTPAETRALEAAQDRAVREARAEMQGRVMRELARERTAWWKDERARVETEVAATLMTRPEWRVINLARGLAADGRKLPEGEAVKLDRAALVAEYGDDIVKLLPAGITTRESGAVHHILAGVMGTDGDGLVKALMAAKAKPLTRTLADETDRVMHERHGDMIADGRIAEDAADIVTTAHAAELVALQAKALKRLAAGLLDKAAARNVAETGAGAATTDRARIDQAVTDTARVENAGIPAAGVAPAQAAEQMARAQAAPTQRRAQSAAMRQVRALLAQLDHAAIRDAAARMIETRPVRDAIAPVPYRAAAARHARAAELAIAARDYPTALVEKQQELLNLELAAAAVRAKAELGKLVTKARRLNQPDAKLAKSMDQDFFKAARLVWSRYGLARADSEFDIQTWMDRLAQDDPAGHADVSAIITRLTAQPVVGRVALRILPNGRRVEIAPDYRDLRLDDLRGIADDVSALLAMGRNAMSALRDGERQDFADMVAEMAAQAGHLTRDTDLRTATTDRDRTAKGLMGVVASARRVESWCRLLDNGAAAGPFTRHIWRPVIAATYAYRQARSGLMGQLHDILAPSTGEYARPQTIAAPELGGFTFANKGELVHAILHSGNDSNLRKLLLGWKWAQPTKDGGFDRAPWDAFVNRMFAQGMVTRADMDRVQAVWDLFEGTKEAAQAAHRAMWGHNFKEIEAGRVPTPWGPYRGGYVPAITDKGKTNDGARHLDADALASQDNAAMFPAVSKGFTQSRVEYNQPLALDLTAIPGHLDRVLKFSHLGPVVRQIARLTRRDDFVQLIGGIDRAAIGDMLIPWLSRVAGQRVDSPASGDGGRLGDGFFRALRRTAGLQAMAGNLVNAVQQVTGIASAAVMVPPRHLADALVRVWRDPALTVDAITAKSALMADRAVEAARQVDADIDALLRHKGPLAQAQDWAAAHGYFAQTIMQNWVDRVVWAAAYDHALAQGMADADAVLHADAVVRQTQGSFAPEDISRAETGPAALRLFTMFYSYFNAQANMLGTEVAVARRTLSGAERGRRLGAITLMGAMIPAVVGEAIVEAARCQLGDEDDDGWADDLIDLFALSQIRYFAAFVPVVGQGVNWALNMFNDKPYDDRIAVSPAISMIESAGRAATSVPKALFGDGDASRAVADGINVLGLVTGLPLGAIRKPVSYAVDVAEGDSRPRHPGHIVSGILTGQDGTGHH